MSVGAHALVATVKIEVEHLSAISQPERVAYIGEVIDALIGTDETALIKGIGPVGELLVEQLSDMVKNLLVEAYARRG